MRSFNGSKMLFTGVFEGPMKSEVIWDHFLDKPVAQRQEMVISSLALLSGLFMVAFEVSRASPAKEIQGESVVVKLYSALWRHVQTSESLSYHLKGLIQPLSQLLRCLSSPLTGMS